jgi:hypothetical protein
MVPLRAGPEFAATLNVTVAGPVPVLAEVTVSHPALLETDHGQNCDACKENERPEEAGAGTLTEVGRRAVVHPPA